MIINYLIFLLIFSPLNDPKGLELGDKAPDFQSKDQNGEIFSLTELLEDGPVIVSFYRGAWCRYCMAQMKNYQDSLSYLHSKNIQLVAISPEHEDGIQKTASISKAEFRIVHDERLKIMLDYKVISEDKRNEYLENLENTGKDLQHKYLPVPATYLIDQGGNIRYVYFDPDYKVRPSVSEVVAALD